MYLGLICLNVTVRKRGRPRKGEEKNPKTAPIEAVRPEEPALPKKGVYFEMQ